MSNLTVLLASISIITIVQKHIVSTLHHDIFDLEVVPSDLRQNFTSLAAQYGYPAQQYDVVTEDGYILTLFHIPGRSRFPVLLQHGFEDSADTWLLRGENSMAIALANRRYDLWFANSRGNRYSRRHTRLNPDTDAEFWDYSFHEIGHYDLPALIDKVLQETGASKLTAMGHSQGTTVFYVLGSTRPEYNEMVNVMISLAPICYFKNSVPPLSTIFKMAPLFTKVFKKLDIHEIFSDKSLETRIYKQLCSTPVLGYLFCVYAVIFPFIGYDGAEFEPNFFLKFIMHYPAGSSARSLLHYLQVGNKDVFAQYDNGPDGNMAVYNQTTPPLYDLGKVTMPIALMTGNNDRLSTIPNGLRLKEALANVIDFVVSPRLLFNHGDSMWGRRMSIYLFPYVFKILERYNGFD